MTLEPDNLQIVRINNNTTTTSESGVCMIRSPLATFALTPTAVLFGDTSRNPRDLGNGEYTNLPKIRNGVGGIRTQDLLI